MSESTGEWAGLIGAERIFYLEQPRTAPMPVPPSHLPGYSYLLHRHYEDEYGPEEYDLRTTA